MCTSKIVQTVLFCINVFGTGQQVSLYPLFSGLRLPWRKTEFSKRVKQCLFFSSSISEPGFLNVTDLLVVVCVVAGLPLKKQVAKQCKTIYRDLGSLLRGCGNKLQVVEAAAKQVLE